MRQEFVIVCLYENIFNRRDKPDEAPLGIFHAIQSYQSSHNGQNSRSFLRGEVGLHSWCLSKACEHLHWILALRDDGLAASVQILSHPYNIVLCLLLLLVWLFHAFVEIHLCPPRAFICNEDSLRFFEIGISEVHLRCWSLNLLLPFVVVFDLFEDYVFCLFDFYLIL